MKDLRKSRTFWIGVCSVVIAVGNAATGLIPSQYLAIILAAAGAAMIALRAQDKMKDEGKE